VVASGQERLPRRRAEGGGVEAVVLQAARRQLLRVRGLAGPPKALEEPNPASSIRMSRTLGAPWGGRSCSMAGTWRPDPSRRRWLKPICVDLEWVELIFESCLVNSYYSSFVIVGYRIIVLIRFTDYCW